VEFYGKAEWFNPGGSVKDRPALEMIREAERSGQLKPGQTILDATSGNTGIAYAMIAAALGYRVKLCLPASASEERKKILKAFGAELVITPGDEGSDGAILRAREIIAAEPGNIFMWISMATREIGAPITRRRPTKSGSRPLDASRISSQDSAPAEHLWARRGA
jgi:cysteine synthase